MTISFYIVFLIIIVPQYSRCARTSAIQFNYKMKYYDISLFTVLI